MTTIKDIAKLSGYSIGTVSRVINGHNDVSQDAKEKILSVIEQEAYQPNANAKLLKQRTNTGITVLIKGRMNVFFSMLLEYIQKELRSSGEEAIVEYIDDFDNEVKAAIRLCNERRPKGIIFLGGNIDHFENDFQQIEIPCVLLTNHCTTDKFSNLSSFATDDVEAGYTAIRFLLKKGHTSIAVIGGSADEFGEGHIDTGRMKGCMKAFEEANIAFDNSKYIPCRFSLEEGYRSMQKLLSCHPQITSVFCMSDIIALGAMRAAYDAHLRIPEDISFIGYDGIPYAYYGVPRLTTISQDVQKLAERGVEDLLMRLSYQRKSRQETIPFHVFPGETVKEVKA